MKWFKHLTGSLDDKFIWELVHVFGGDGYLVFFGTLEIMADEFDIDNPGKNTFYLQYLKEKLQVSHQKLTRILTFCNNYAEKNPKKNKGLFANIEGKSVHLNSPRLKDLADEWTQKQLGSHSGVSPELNRESLPPIEVRSKNKEEDIKEKESKKKKSAHAPYHTPEYQELRKQAIDVLHYLNEKAGKKYDDDYPGISHIIERLQELPGVEDCKRVIDTKLHDPHFIRNRNFLSPDTLFKEGNFYRYAAESPEDYDGVVEAEEAEPQQPKTDVDGYRKHLTESNPKLVKWFNDEILSKIKKDVAPESFRAWFEPLVPVSLENKMLLIFVPRSFYLSWHSEHYKTVWKEAMSGEGTRKYGYGLTCEIPEDWK